jgi:predicted outer membrane repeat protein
VRNLSELTNGNGTVTIENCSFTENEVNSHGGALVNSSVSNGVSVMNVRRCTMTNNTAASNGGAIYANSSTRNATNPVTASTTNVENCVFFANSSMGLGGAIFNEGLTGAPSTLNVTNCTFASNTASGGSGLSNSATSPATAPVNITNCVFWNNTFTSPTSALFNNVGTGATINVRNSSLQHATFASNETGTGAFNNLGGFIAGDPNFVNLALGDLQLEFYSACVDAGAVVALTVDIDGNARPQGAGFDMGAYEVAPIARPMAREPELVVDMFDASVFPNPTTGAFTLTLDREITGFVQVFDVQGRLVSTEQINGSNQTQLDLSAESSGIYLLRIVAGNEVLTKQVAVQRP